jgi:hypothetical protein
MVKRALLALVLATASFSLTYAETLVQADPLSVPAGTLIHCRITETLTTKLNLQGDAFIMNLAEPVSINGGVALPVGSTVAGHITRLERPGRIKGVGRMHLTVEQITLPNGSSFPLSATLLTAYGADNVKVVGNEGLVKGPSSHVPDLEEIGGGTAGGALLGLILGHPLVGATVGAAATTVDRMRRRGKDLTLPVGTQLNYELTRELAVTRNASRIRAANQVHVVAD